MSKVINISNKDEEHPVYEIDGKKYSWAVIQSAPADPDGEESVPAIDATWTNLRETDIPQWVNEPEIMGRMMAGEMVSIKPEQGGLWYRAVRTAKPTMN